MTCLNSDLKKQQLFYNVFNITSVPWDPQLWHVAEMQLSMTLSWTKKKPFNCDDPRTRFERITTIPIEAEPKDLEQYDSEELLEWYRYVINQYRKVYEPERFSPEN